MNTVKTYSGQEIDVALLNNFLKRMVNDCYKILPMRENGESTLSQYIDSTIVEFTGCGDYISCMGNDARFVAVMSILKYFHEHLDAPVSVYKREVFKAISLCKRCVKIIYKDWR